MKNAGPILLGLFALGISAALTYAVLGGSQPPAPKSEDEFLASIKQDAAKAPDAAPSAKLPPVTSSDPAAIPRIELEAEQRGNQYWYDMGVIPNDRIETRQVKVFNRGKAPLQVSRVSTSCGCTTGQMASNDPIAPGEYGVLNVSVDPSKIPGFTATRTLTLFTNDPVNNAVRMDVKADVTPEIAIEPDSLDFGVVAKGESAERTVRIRQLESKPFEIKDAKIQGYTNVLDVSFQAVPEAQWAKPGHREYLVTARVLPDAPSGDFPRSHVMLETNLARYPRPSVPVSVRVKGVYDIQPTIVTLRSVQPGQRVEGVLRVSSDVPIEITSVEAENKALAVSHHPGDEPNSFVFDLTVADNPQERLQRDTWVLGIKAGGKEYKENIRVLAVVDPEGGAKTPASPPVQPVAPGTGGQN